MTPKALKHLLVVYPRRQPKSKQQSRINKGNERHSNVFNALKVTGKKLTASASFAAHDGSALAGAADVVTSVSIDAMAGSTIARSSFDRLSRAA